MEKLRLTKDQMGRAYDTWEELGVVNVNSVVEIDKTAFKKVLLDVGCPEEYMARIVDGFFKETAKIDRITFSEFEKKVEITDNEGWQSLIRPKKEKPATQVEDQDASTEENQKPADDGPNFAKSNLFDMYKGLKSKRSSGSTKSRPRIPTIPPFKGSATTKVTPPSTSPAAGGNPASSAPSIAQAPEPIVIDDKQKNAFDRLMANMGSDSQIQVEKNYRPTTLDSNESDASSAPTPAPSSSTPSPSDAPSKPPGKRSWINKINANRYVSRRDLAPISDDADADVPSTASESIASTDVAAPIKDPSPSHAIASPHIDTSALSKENQILREENEALKNREKIHLENLFQLEKEVKSLNSKISSLQVEKSKSLRLGNSENSRTIAENSQLREKILQLEKIVHASTSPLQLSAISQLESVMHRLDREREARDLLQNHIKNLEFQLEKIQADYSVTGPRFQTAAIALLFTIAFFVVFSATWDKEF